MLYRFEYRTTCRRVNKSADVKKSCELEMYLHTRYTTSTTNVFLTYFCCRATSQSSAVSLSVYLVYIYHICVICIIRPMYLSFFFFDPSTDGWVTIKLKLPYSTYQIHRVWRTRIASQRVCGQQWVLSIYNLYVLHDQMYLWPTCIKEQLVSRRRWVLLFSRFEGFEIEVYRGRASPTTLDKVRAWLVTPP